MAVAKTAFALGGLAGRLVTEGVVDESTAAKVQEDAEKNGESFVLSLLATKGVDSERFSIVASEDFGIPLVDVDSVEIDQDTVALVSEKLMTKHKVLPLYKRGRRLFLAIVDPTNTSGLDEIKFHTGMGVEPILVDSSKLTLKMDDAISASDTSFADLAGDDGLDDIDISSEEDHASQDNSDAEDIDTPVVRFVNKLLLDSLNKGASDIHFEPYETTTRVRFRIDGVLHEIASPPVSMAGRLVARIKILSKLDIAERRIPQDGRMKMRLSKKRSIDFRVSTLPTLFGEKVVIRILDADITTLGIEVLGFEPDQQALYEESIQRPYGMVLVTGPTGSGKTVSLYTALGILNTVERNISTAEDPVEINVPGINQVNINDKANLTFANALRAFLRQDPDVIMVGEIRDLETAEIAVKAAQTGHLVLSTLHTNDGPSTITRLLNMGVEPFNVASSVHLILAQRLGRKLCEHCKAPVDIPEKALLSAGFKQEQLEGLVIHAPVGCDNCTGGYKGRVGIFQIMPVSETTAELIMKGATALDIEKQIESEGIYGLREAGLKKNQRRHGSAKSGFRQGYSASTGCVSGED